jgi:hypothetical protein
MASAHSERTAWALVYGLAERESRRLVVVLPHDAAFATMQRTALAHFRPLPVGPRGAARSRRLNVRLPCARTGGPHRQSRRVGKQPGRAVAARGGQVASSRARSAAGSLHHRAIRRAALPVRVVAGDHLAQRQPGPTDRVASQASRRPLPVMSSLPRQSTTFGSTARSTKPATRSADWRPPTSSKPGKPFTAAGCWSRPGRCRKGTTFRCATLSRPNRTPPH